MEGTQKREKERDRGGRGVISCLVTGKMMKLLERRGLRRH